MGTLLTLLVIGLVGVVALGIVATVVSALFGVVFGLAGFLLFKVAPVLLVGWLAVKLVQRVRGKRRTISPADQAWLDS